MSWWWTGRTVSSDAGPVPGARSEGTIGRGDEEDVKYMEGGNRFLDIRAASAHKDPLGAVYRRDRDIVTDS